MQTQFPHKEHYHKYLVVKSKLEEELQTEQSVKEIAAKVGISVPTFHKYKNFLQLEVGRSYATREERNFMKRLQERKDTLGLLEKRAAHQPTKQGHSATTSATPAAASVKDSSVPPAAQISSPKATPSAVPQEPLTSSSESTATVTADGQPSAAAGTSKAQQPKGKKHEKKP